ncbi:MAG: amidohydrolase family protein [Pseudomonadales bacterium]|nr:amidohydrolase family protein [Pseudomonadales bacterium]
MNDSEPTTMDKAAWLAQVSEDIIEPDLPICDPHHHLWDKNGSRYLLHELLEDTGSGHNIVSTVFVECASMYRATGPEALKPVGETEFVQGQAAMSASGEYGNTLVAAGIVSFADLCLGADVRPVLEAHIAASPNRFRGIRHAVSFHSDERIRNAHTHPPEHLMLDERFRTGFAELERLGLTFDAWFYHHQLAEFIDLARTFPNVSIVLDHLGGPLGIGPYEGKSAEVFAVWKDHISELSECMNVHLKLGGINMKVNGHQWHKRDKPPGSDELANTNGPWFEHCIDSFGADRCMFESNFPVDKESASYPVIWNAFKKLSAGRSPEEKSALFHDTATRFYRLAPA